MYKLNPDLFCTQQKEETTEIFCSFPPQVTTFGVTSRLTIPASFCWQQINMELREENCQIPFCLNIENRNKIKQKEICCFAQYLAKKKKSHVKRRLILVLVSGRPYKLPVFIPNSYMVLPCQIGKML